MLTAPCSVLLPCLPPLPAQSTTQKPSAAPAASTAPLALPVMVHASRVPPPSCTTRPCPLFPARGACVLVRGRALFWCEAGRCFGARQGVVLVRGRALGEEASSTCAHSREGTGQRGVQDPRPKAPSLPLIKGQRINTGQTWGAAGCGVAGCKRGAQAPAPTSTQPQAGWRMARTPNPNPNPYPTLTLTLTLTPPTSYPAPCEPGLCTAADEHAILPARLHRAVLRARKVDGSPRQCWLSISTLACLPALHDLSTAPSCGHATACVLGRSRE